MQIFESGNHSNDPVRQVSAFVLVNNAVYVGQNHIPFLFDDHIIAIICRDELADAAVNRFFGMHPVAEEKTEIFTVAFGKMICKFL